MTITDALRADFPVLDRHVDGAPLVYLDNAATTLKPRAVIDAVTRYYSEVSANIHRGKHILSEEASDAYEAARMRVAAFVGARANEVVFTAGTTMGLNLVADGLDLARDALAVVSPDAHHSMQLPLRDRCEVAWLPTRPDGDVDLDGYAVLLARRPAVVALTHCSNVTGRYTPVAELAAMAHEHGALVVVDAAQSVPHRRIRMADLGADALAFSAHKMLGPTGIGVLVLGPALVDRLRPALVGGGTVDWVDLNGSVPRRSPFRFEAGTPHIAGAYGLLAAVDYLERLGMAEVAAHDALLAGVLAAEVAKRDYLTEVAPTGSVERSAITSVTVRGAGDLTEFARALSDSYGVMCRSGHLCAQPYVDAQAGGQVLRVSAYLYNTADEIRAAFTALDELHPLLETM